MTTARFERRRFFYWLLTTVYCLLLHVFSDSNDRAHSGALVVRAGRADRGLRAELLRPRAGLHPPAADPAGDEVLGLRVGAAGLGLLRGLLHGARHPLRADGRPREAQVAHRRWARRVEPLLGADR